jgi:pimeloyl-ACP methyl ester carboxylesterase
MRMTDNSNSRILSSGAIQTGFQLRWINWLVFGGWALPPSLLEPLFGPDAAYIDTNAIMPYLVNDGKLHSDWQQKLFNIVEKKSVIPDKPFGIAGWSTGAMLAWSIACRLNPAAGVFISATPSFCRRRESGFSYGQKCSVLKSMREQLLIDPEAVLMKFYEQCGMQIDVNNDISTSRNSNYPLNIGHVIIENQIKQFNGYSIDQLISGLHFLEQATLLPLEMSSFPALFIHGKDDTVIPIDAGRYFCTEASGTFVEHDSPHAFFQNYPVALTKSIDDFIQKAL